MPLKGHGRTRQALPVAKLTTLDPTSSVKPWCSLDGPSPLLPSLRTQGISEILTSTTACDCPIHSEAALMTYCLVHHLSPVPGRHGVPQTFHGHPARAHTFCPLSPATVQSSRYQGDVCQVRPRHTGSSTWSPPRTQWDLCG